ncbi:PAS domain S-box protein [Sphingosinicellaceae bacterium]|nr:PAS domain S-box protein [Sphingosinicellaceae bacterium]
MIEASQQRQNVEDARLAALERYSVLDTPRERELDDIVAIAAQICGVPTALISLIDDKRQWFKAALGLELAETPREIAFCARAIEEETTMVIEDASQDDRFAANPLVTGDTHLRFYAGAQLRTPDGMNLGTLCVLDTVPRVLTADQRVALEALARQVMTHFELRRLLKQKHLDEARHRLVIDTALDYAIITTDLKGVIDSWSEGAARMFNRSAREVCGQPMAILFTPNDVAADIPVADLADALEQSRVFDERWHPRADGSLFWARCELMPLRNADQRAHGFLKIMQDRTIHRAAEKDLRESETRVRLALEAAELGAWEAHPGTGEVFGDTRTRELLGHASDGVIPFETFLDRVHAVDRAGLVASVEASFESGGQGKLDAEFRVDLPADEPVRWLRSRAQVIKRPGERHRLVGTVRDISAEKAAEEHRQLLTNELQHRVKNTLGVVQGIVSQSLRTVATPAEARDAITSRLSTLAHAHDLLTQTSWTAAPISAVIEGAVLAHCSEVGRVVISGPEVKLNARAALALSMALHELFTNAVKYGSMSNETGIINLSWTIVDGEGGETFELRWQERGGPSVEPPTRAGFGTRLTGSSLAGDLGGKGVVEYHPDGVRWSLSTNLMAISDTGASL